MEALKKVDEVAYVRYASVYRKFQDTKAFVKEIKQMNHPPAEKTGVPEKPEKPEEAK